MNRKIEALQTLLNAIDQKNFKIDAWKIKASLVIQKIYGPNDPKLVLIDKLHYDYSSWSLRDENGSQVLDSVKEQARGIIEASILEETLDLDNSPLKVTQEILGDEFQNLQNKLEESQVNEEVLMEYFSKIASTKKDLILARIILKDN